MHSACAVGDKMASIDDLFQDATTCTTASSTCDSNTTSQLTQVLSRLDTEDESVYVLLCRERASLKLTVCAGSQAWAGVLTAAELCSMASVVGMDTDEYIQETERALTGRPLSTDNFVYSVSRHAKGLQLAWKRHLLADNVKFQLGSVVLKPEQASNALLDHAVSSTQHLQDRITHTERENQRLVQEQKTILERLEQCAHLKEQLEVDLYSKFKVVLNEKKSKIRRLMEELASYQSQCKSPIRHEASKDHEQEQDKSEPDPPPSPTPGLLGEQQDVVSPPVKRRKREARHRGGRGPYIPLPPSISRPSTTEKVRLHVAASDSNASDDLLQLL